MDCPKCSGSMKEIKLEVLHGQLSYDQCENCKGMWFDTGEAEELKKEWMSDFVDRGDPKEGKRYNQIRDIDCPRCGDRMEQVTDPKQKHIEYEACTKHGVFLDAGEFSDFKNETLSDIFKGMIARLKRK